MKIDDQHVLGEGAEHSATSSALAFDHQTVLRELEAHNEDLNEALAIEAERALRAQSTKQLLTFYDFADEARVICPKANRAYATLLMNYVKGKDLGHTQAGGGSRHRCVRKAMVEFYQKADAPVRVRESVVSALQTNDVLIRTFAQRLGRARQGWSAGAVGTGRRLQDLGTTATDRAELSPFLAGTIARSLATMPLALSMKKAAASALLAAGSKAAAGTAKHTVAAGILKTSLGHSIVTKFAVQGGQHAHRHHLLLVAYVSALRASSSSSTAGSRLISGRDFGKHSRSVMPALIPELHTEFVSSLPAVATDEAVAVTGEFASFLADA